MKTPQRISKAYDALIHWHDFRIRLFAEGILIGLSAGVIIVLFRYILEQAERLRGALYGYLQGASWAYTGLWFLTLLLIAWILQRITVFEPMTSGSGIPQVKGAIMGLMKMKWLRILLGKFTGGILAIGAGLSLGREGPSIQLGAIIGQGLSRSIGRTRMEERYLLTSGASAGLAAAFNAPLAGVIFSLEELHKSFSPAVLMSAVAAALTADVVTRHFFGANPVFSFTNLPVFPLRYYSYLILLGLLVGWLGILFNRVLLKTLCLYEKQPWLTGMWKPALPLITAGILGFLLPEVLGGGNNLVNALAVAPFSLSILCILLAAKFLFTMVSYGSGVPGGIFLPLLVIGALAGGIFSHIVVHFGLLAPLYSTNIVIFAMAAYFSAVVKSPITGSILIMEMTGSFAHMLPLIVVSMAAYLVADICKSDPIYDSLLTRALAKQGKLPHNVTANDRVIMEIGLDIGSKLHGKQVKQIDWPPNCLLVSIKRGDTELVPKGNTRLIAGDYLYVLTDMEQNDLLQELVEDKWCKPALRHS